MTVKKIVFLSLSGADILAQLDKIREYQRNPDWEVVVIATRYHAQRICKQYGISFKTTIDYLTTARHYQAYTESMRLAVEWYKYPMIEKTLSHDGVLLGEIIEYEIKSVLAGFLLDIELYQGIIETEKPDKIIIVKNLLSEPVTQDSMDMSVYEEFIIGSLSKQKGICLDFISLKPEGVEKSRKEAILKKSALLRELNSIKTKLMNYAGMFLFLDWRIEIRRKLQKWWYYFFYNLNSGRVKNAFSRKQRRIAFLNLRCAAGVADFLKKDPDNGVVFLMGPGQKQRSLNFLPTIYLESFGTPEIDRIIEEKRGAFKGILQQAQVANYLEEIFSYNGLNFWEVAAKTIEYVLDARLPLIVRGMELVKQMIEEVGLNVVISSSDVNSEIRAMTRAMQQKRKKVLIVHHGIDYFTPEASEVFAKSLVPPIADKVATWGEASKEWFIDQGAPPDSIEVTSCSDFDNYLGMLNRSQGSLRRYLGIPSHKKVILYTLDHANRKFRHPYIVETRDEILLHLKNVIQEITRLPQFYLVVRPHPGDQYLEEIEQIIMDAGKSNVSYSNPRLPLIFYLQEADIIITHTSSSALEAMIFNKDVLIYNPTDRPELVPFAQDGAAVKVDSRDKLIPSLKKMIEDDSLRTQLSAARKQFVNRCAGPLDGNATRNIVELIIKMIGD